MSDCFFDAARACGEYPRKGYNLQTEKQKIVEITRKIKSGWREEWVLKEAVRLNISIPDDNE